MKKRWIVAVDDEPGITTMLKLNLEKTGLYSVITENRAEAAVATIRAAKPELVLLDVVMPGKDGGQILAELRADKELRTIPVLVMTATVTSQSVDASKGIIGGMPVVAKPIDTKVLLRRIEETIGGSAVFEIKI
jgi:DNA-binding response OmpR family regulator